MKRTIFKSALLAAVTLIAGISVPAAAQSPIFRHVDNTTGKKWSKAAKAVIKKNRSNITETQNNSDTLTVRSVDEILLETPVVKDIPTFNRLNAPWVFSEYRALDKRKNITAPDSAAMSRKIWKQVIKMQEEEMGSNKNPEIRETADSVSERQKLLDSLWGVETKTEENHVDTTGFNRDKSVGTELEILSGDPIPQWFKNATDAWNMQEDLMYRMMVDDPRLIEYSYWQLPVPPTLPEEDHGFKGFLKRVATENVNVDAAVISDADILKKHWLHVVNGSLQFSQAYVSDNWYQGGNNHVALLCNFLWDVQLNPVWHPNVLFQSTLSYKLGLNSVEEDQYRKYAISQDIFQHNLKFGYKAKRNWYYSITTQFKTQLLNNYTKNSQTRIASFLTPGDLNIGLGMTYSKINKKKTAQFNASISPLSYNLKTAIDPDVNHELFKIPQTAKTDSEFGSNAEITFNWAIGKMVTYKTRLFLFTDYHYFTGDWQNTVNVQFSRFFSTQIFVNLRYDSNADKTIDPKWKRFMLKEILSIGLSYTFSTKG